MLLLMPRVAKVLCVLLVVGALVAAPAGADEVSDAQAKVERTEQDLARLRAEYNVLAEQARGVEGSLDSARLRVINLQRSIDDESAKVGEARKAVSTRARRAYMGETLGNVGAALRLRDYAQIDAYLPYIAGPLEEDRRALAVYQDRLRALRNLQADLDGAETSAMRQATDLSGVQTKLATNLRAQQDKLAGARKELAAAQAQAQVQAARALPAAQASTGEVPRGPQPGSGPGPEAGIPDPIDVPPAPATLPNGVALGPVAGIPAGMRSAGIRFSGVASWYGPGFHGHTTASGEVYDQYGFTAAHRDLPFGTVLLVSFHDRSVLLRVTDRGPFIEGRVLDLSQGAAEALGIGGLGYIDAEILVSL